MTKGKQIRILLSYLEWFMGDKNKVQSWLEHPNPGLRLRTPREMIERGQLHHVIRFVERSLDEQKKAF